MNAIKRPVIFARNLTHEEVIKLIKHSKELYGRFSGNYPPNMQIFAYKDGELNLVVSGNVYNNEIECKTYDEFMTHWEQYKLFHLL